MYERQGREGLLLQQKGAEWLSRLDIDRVTAEAAIRAVVEGAKLERMALGEPGERDEVRRDEGQHPRLQELDDDELASLIEHAERAMARARDPEP
jgi:hypothetical protein